MAPKSKSRSKKKKQRPEGYDPNEARRQRLEAKRAARLEAEKARQRKAAREKWVRRGVYVALFGTAVWFFFLRGQPPSEIEGHELLTFSVAGEGDHISEGNTISYESTPPVSGSHWPTPGACGILSEQIPNERQVHTLEHGAVGIQYDPSLDPEQIKQIEEIVRDFDSHVFSAPYSGMPEPIAVSSWGELMRLETVDESAIREYIDTFRDKGPEKNPCPTSANSPFVPADQQTPVPTPAATATIGGDSGDDGDKDGGGKRRGDRNAGND